MSILLYIDRDVEDQEIIKQSVLPGVTLIDNVEDALQKTNVARVGILFHNQGMSFVPFARKVVGERVKRNVVTPKVKYDMKGPKRPLPRDNSNVAAPQKYSCYTNDFVDLLKELKQKFTDVTVDIISCAMKGALFNKETAEIITETGVKIEYSTNQTGHGVDADWILESNNQNLIGLYFNDNILSWRHALIYTVVTGSAVTALFDEGVLTYSDGVYKMTSSNTMATPYRTIMLKDGEIFDGGGYTLTININRSGMFIVDSGSKKTTVKNLTVSFDDYVSTSQASSKIGGGGIMRPFQSNFTIDNCTVTNTLQRYCGGICGSYCSNFDIVNCTSNGQTGNEHVGGIVGAFCCDFNVVNCDNYLNNFCDSGDDMGGGIVGYSCKSFTVVNSTNYGALESDMLGGIVGGQCSDFTVKNCRCNYDNYDDMYYGSGGIVGAASFNFTVENCTNNYPMGSDSCGGIVAYGCYDFTIKKCKNNADIDGWGCGGIVGANCSNFKLYDCVNTGTIDSSGSGGICGANTGLSAYKPYYPENYMYTPSYTYGKNVIEINNCINYGDVAQIESGGICGVNLGRVANGVYDPDEVFPYVGNKMPNNIKITLNNCVNHGNLTGSSGGGIAGGYLGSINVTDFVPDNSNSYGNMYGISNAVITFNKCETKSGSLCGWNVLNNNVNGFTTGNNNGVFNSRSKLLINASYVPDLSTPLLGSLGSQIEGTEIIYTPLNGAPTDLIANPYFSAVAPN